MTSDIINYNLRTTSTNIKVISNYVELYDHNNNRFWNDVLYILWFDHKLIYYFAKAFFQTIF